jgi:hypothetical protein
MRKHAGGLSGDWPISGGQLVRRISREPCPLSGKLRRLRIQYSDFGFTPVRIASTRRGTRTNSEVNDVVRDGEAGQAGYIVDFQLAHETFAVCLHSTKGDVQFAGDLLGAASQSDEF